MTMTYDWCNCGDSGLSAGAIAGIVIGSAVGLVLVIGCVYYLFCKYDKYEIDDSAVNAMEPKVRKSIIEG